MSILNDIRLALLKARKAREFNHTVLLITLFSEASMIGKNDGGRDTTDLETIAVIKKFIKNIDETFSTKTFAHGDQVAVDLINERLMYNSFLPRKTISEALNTKSSNIWAAQN